MTRKWNWQEWKIPYTPCSMIGKNYSEMKKVQGRLMDRYPQYEFCLKCIAPHTWAMMFSK